MELQRDALSCTESKVALDKMISCLVQSAVVPIILVNRQGYIVFLNQAYEEWSGLVRENVIGRHITEVVENTRTHIAAATGKADLQQVQKCFGKIVLSNRIPIFDENHELLGAWGIVDVNDISGITNLSKRIVQLENQLSKYENELRSYQSVQYTFDDIIGRAPSIEAVIEEAKLAAGIAVDVLIRGESGTGKELFAHAIHNASVRGKGPFVSITCSCLPYNRIEEVLFGEEDMGGPDGGVRIGKIESANGGTLFLDEIGDMPIDIQSKLLHLIERREITRVGGQAGVRLNIRLIASTNHDLESMVRTGVFRSDLYYALTAFVLTVPPLRKRKSDIPELVSHFTTLYTEIYNCEPKSFTPAALQELKRRDWPGNVRELSNLVKNTVIRTPEGTLAYTLLGGRGCVPEDVKTERVSLGPLLENNESLTVQDMELQIILSALKKNRGNIRKSAQMLDIDRNTLYRKLRKYKIDCKEFRTAEIEP